PSCLRELQFPEPDGQMTGFTVRAADGGDAAGRTHAEVERAWGVRLVAVDGETQIRRDAPIAPGARLIVYGALDRLQESAPRQVPPEHRPSWWRRMRGLLRRRRSRLHRVDPYIAGFVVTVVLLFALGTWYFRNSFQSDWLTAAYFVMSTMTTTG